MKSKTKTKTKKNRNGGETIITFIEWHMADEILDRYAPGWEWEPVISLSADGPISTPVTMKPTITGRCNR